MSESLKVRVGGNMKKQGVIFFLLSGVSFICLLITRFLLGGWVDYLWIPLGFFVVFLGLGLWSFRNLYREFWQVKTTKEGLSMGASILLTLVLLIAVNFLGARNYKTFDFSAAQVNSLSDQTRLILKNLKSEIQVLYFYKKGAEGVEDARAQFVLLLKKYQDESSKVKLQFVEVNENPKLAQEYSVNQGGGVVFVDYQGRRNKIQKIDEQELTGAIVKVTREKDKKIYYVIGHGERDLEDGRELTGANLFKKLLEGNRYSVQALHLNQNPVIPDDTDVLMILGAEQAYMDHELTAIEDYLKKGGNVFFAVKYVKETGLSKLLEKLGVSIQGNHIVQVLDTPLGKVVNPQATPVTEFSSSNLITKPFGQGQFVLMRMPAAIMKGSLPNGISYEEILKTDKASLAYQDLGFKGAAVAGPFVTGALLKGPLVSGAKEFQMIVYSDAEFASNQLLYKNLNRDLALNTVSYLAKEENIISISPKEVNVTQLQMTDTQFYIFIFAFIIPLPLLLIGTSTFIWYRRRFA